MAQQIEDEALDPFQHGDRIRDGLIVEEFKSLRDEILKRTELANRLVNLTVVAAGALLGFSNDAPRMIFWFYPILVLFLACQWSFDNMRVTQIGTYIRENLERIHLGENKGWEHFLCSPRSDTPLSQQGLTGVFGASCIFFCLQFGVLIVGWFWKKPYPSQTLDVVLVGFDLLVIILTLVLTVYSHRMTHFNAKQLGREAAHRVDRKLLLFGTLVTLVSFVTLVTFGFTALSHANGLRRRHTNKESSLSSVRFYRSPLRSGITPQPAAGNLPPSIGSPPALARPTD